MLPYTEKEELSYKWERINNPCKVVHHSSNVTEQQGWNNVWQQLCASREIDQPHPPPLLIP